MVPEERVTDAFEELGEDMPEECQPVVDYFEDTYIGRPHLRTRRRRPPTFPHSMGNMHQRSEEELPRTNNSVEGWHRRFSANIGCYNPNFWKFLSALKNE